MPSWAVLKSTALLFLVVVNGSMILVRVVEMIMLVTSKQSSAYPILAKIADYHR